MATVDQAIYALGYNVVGTRDINESTAALQKNMQAAEGVVTTQEKVERATHTASESMQRYRGHLGSTGSSVQSLTSQIAELASKFGSRGGAIAQIADQFGNVAKASQDSSTKATSGISSIIPLATRYIGIIGLIYAGYEAVKGVIGTSSDASATRAKAVEANLTEEARLVGLITQMYGNANTAAAQLARKDSASTLFQQDIANQTTSGQLQSGVGAFVSQFTRPGEYMVKQEFSDIASAIDAVRASAARGTPDIVALRNALTGAGRGDLLAGTNDLMTTLSRLQMGEARSASLRDPNNPGLREAAGLPTLPAATASAGPSRYAMATQSIRDQIEEMDLQAKSAGRVTEEVTKLKTAHDLERSALRSGTLEMPGVRAEIDKLSDAYANQSRILAEAKLAADLYFERQQLGRSPADQAAFSRLRSAGIDPNSASGQNFANDIRVNESLKEAQSVTSGYFSQVRADIASGVNAWQAFGNAGEKALARITDSLIKIATDKLLAQAFGSLFSTATVIPGGGSIGGGATGVEGVNLGSVTGHSGGIVGNLAVSRYIHPAYFDDAPRFHGGGMVGGDEVPIIARKGERIATPEQWADHTGPKVVVNIINDHPNAKIEQQTRTQGGMEIRDLIISTVNEGIVGGRSDSSLGARTGARPNVRRRG